MSGQSVRSGQRVVLEACPGFDINNNEREFFGEFVVDSILPCEIELLPRVLDRYEQVEDQAIFVRLPLPGAHYFWIEEGSDD